MSTNKLVRAGQQLSNICYNMKQNDTLPQHVRDSMEECVKAWDEALQEHNRAQALDFYFERYWENV